MDQSEGPERRRKIQDNFQNVTPQYVRYDDLSQSLCYGGIELFVIQDPEGGSDVPVAIVETRNIKGTE